MRVVVLASGQGSNFRALLKSASQSQKTVNIVGVISDRPNTPALAFADSQGVKTDVVDFRTYSDRREWDGALKSRLDLFQADLIVLAGFMRIVGPLFLDAYRGKSINTHPSLLPAFPGRDAPAQALRAKVRISGCTVHVVDDGIDTGPIIAQAAVPVLPNDDPSVLHARIQRAEHLLLSQVVHAVASGQVRLSPDIQLFGVDMTTQAQLFWPTFGPNVSATAEHP
ncbi:MAG: phosphoribosylglycinamide formyltransferase [Myxococcales bacterium]|nr:phosphoribosylglycinamide formyltransferase [Myxococcales bacterium]